MEQAGGICSTEGIREHVEGDRSMKRWRKKSLCFMLAVVAIISLASGCEKVNENEELNETSISEESKEEIPVEMMELVGEEPMSIVYASGMSDVIKELISGLKKELSDQTKRTIKCYGDAADDPAKLNPEAREILVGRTNRPLSAELTDKLEPDSFSITMTERQILIVGTDDEAIYHAVKIFMENIVGDPMTVIGEGSAVIPKRGYEGKKDTRSNTELLASGEELVAMATKLIEIPKKMINDDRYFCVQGGCAYGEYAYQALVNKNYTGCVIVKYRIDTWEEVMRSEPMPLGHANDIAYNPERGELYITMVKNDAKYIGVLDEQTLTFKENRKLDGLLTCYSLDYCEERECFATGTALTATGIYSPDFDFISLNLPAHETELVTQGICCDENYVYHLLYGGSDTPLRKNELIVYDWEGNFIAQIMIGVEDEEPENISIVDDRMYIAFNNYNWTGGVVYELNLTSAANRAAK